MEGRLYKAVDEGGAIMYTYYVVVGTAGFFLYFIRKFALIRFAYWEDVWMKSSLIREEEA